MKIYLVAPKNPESFWTFDRILDTVDARCMFSNLALPTLAALTPSRHEVVLCDENVGTIDFDIDADIVGVSGYIIHQKRMKEIMDEFRRRGRFVAVGGPFASLCPDDLAGHADVVFVDEAEETWPRFLEDFEAGRPAARYVQEEKTNMETVPLPRFDLLNLSAYRTVCVQFARGCPFTCEFCDIITIFGRRPRAKSIPQLMAEIRELARLGVERIFLVDDNFIGDKRRAKALLRAIVAFGEETSFSVDFNTEVSLDVAQDEEMLQLLRDANFQSIFIGIETPRKASLLETKKRQNARGDILQSVLKVQSYGIRVDAGMIVGFDNDDPAIFQEQFDFIQAARIPVSMTGMLNAVPKTPLHDRLAKDSRLISLSTGDQFIMTNIIPKSMTSEQLYQGYRDLIARLYDFDNMRRRVMDYLLTRGGQVKEKLYLNRGDLKIGWRVLRDCILFTSSARRRFTLSVLAQTLAFRPSAIKEAITVAVLHKHFYEYMQDVCRQLEGHLKLGTGMAAAPALPGAAAG
ncbi:MAG TPA: radical SAM protein [Candidatus Polarisedimenticolia bacterium]|nr:radical SAM protein [Candidatus Polarisedimenticolia bacterium]